MECTICYWCYFIYIKILFLLGTFIIHIHFYVCRISLFIIECTNFRKRFSSVDEIKKKKLLCNSIYSSSVYWLVLTSLERISFLVVGSFCFKTSVTTWSLRSLGILVLKMKTIRIFIFDIKLKMQTIFKSRIFYSYLYIYSLANYWEIDPIKIKTK
jgi:hypothetical protein